MLGVLLAVAFSAIAALAGRFSLGHWSPNLDPAERWGVSGLIGLGYLALASLLCGMFPHGVVVALVGAPILGVALGFGAVRSRFLGELKFALPKSTELLALIVLVLIGLLALVAVLAPSIASDWDTIAYHLAVPKLWLSHGQVTSIQGIHHSNFPSTMEMLFMQGLAWGGQSGAKAFSLVVYAFGCLATFGLARRWYGQSAGWWAALAFAGIPVVAWESGTGYIDVAHGLYCALGAIYAVDALKSEPDRSKLVLSGLCLGFAMGTKYTGLQMLIATVAVVAFAAMFKHGLAKAVKVKLTIVLIALIVGGAWYVRTAVNTGNPVFPFFYSVLGGRDWDAWRAEIYTNEQKSFGVGSSPTDVGHAILGLAYQPGRYTNPGPAQGLGFPTGAIGFACLLGGVCAATSGRLRREERLLLAIVLLQFLFWFFLSQQSRYLTMLAIPLGVLGAGIVSRVKWGPVVAAAIAAQAVYTIYLINATQTQAQLQVVTGKVSNDGYLTQLMSPFYPATKVMNALPSSSKVALYDEVFGFYLDVPYFWANPGHSKMIPYEEMETAEDYTQSLRKLGFTHVYANLVGADQRYVKALSGQEPYSDKERAALFPNLDHRWHVLLSEARQKGLIEEVKVFKGAVLYRIVR